MRKMFSLIIFFCLFGCASSNADVIERDDYTHFFYMTIAEQESLYKKRSLNEQFEILLYGNQIMHPPTHYLAKTFAENGPKVIPFLKQKLEVTKSELTVRDITIVFVEFEKMKTYDFSKDPDLMRLLERRVNGMKGLWKAHTLEMLEHINVSHGQP
jgi:hypothetical protein